MVLTYGVNMIFKKGQRVVFEFEDKEDDGKVCLGTVVGGPFIDTEIDRYVYQIVMDNPEHQEWAWDICAIGMAEEYFDVVPNTTENEIGVEWYKFYRGLI